MSTLHIHLDESGDFRFTPKGSKYYVFAAVWTFQPRELATSVTNLRFSLLKQGHNLPCFHAAPDQQRNRDAMVMVIGDIRTYEKLVTNLALPGLEALKAGDVLYY